VTGQHVAGDQHTVRRERDRILGNVAPARELDRHDATEVAAVDEEPVADVHDAPRKRSDGNRPWPAGDVEDVLNNQFPVFDSPEFERAIRGANPQGPSRLPALDEGPTLKLHETSFDRCYRHRGVAGQERHVTCGSRELAEAQHVTSEATQLEGVFPLMVVGHTMMMPQVSGEVPMSAVVTNRQGAMISDPSPDVIASVLAELDGPQDDEHPDVALSHESGWTLSAFPSGLVIFENVEGDDAPRHLAGMSRKTVHELWSALMAEDFAALEQQPWRPGHGP
jgi:hypothetical protein